MALLLDARIKRFERLHHYHLPEYCEQVVSATFMPAAALLVLFLARTCQILDILCTVHAEGIPSTYLDPKPSEIHRYPSVQRTDLLDTQDKHPLGSSRVMRRTLLQ